MKTIRIMIGIAWAMLGLWGPFYVMANYSLWYAIPAIITGIMCVMSGYLQLAKHLA